MADVFVSYASQDREQVRPIVEALIAVGWSVWWDREIGAGSTFDREIEKAIDNAKCVVVVWTENSVESEWVRTEANEGLEKNILVPIQLSPIKPPLAFRRIQMIDLSSTSNFDALTEAVATLVSIPIGIDSDLTPFIGREKEKSIVESRLASAERGEGDFILLSGDAGVGKSRLAQEVTNEAIRRGFMVLSGHSLDMEGAPPYQPLLEQIEQASRIVPTDVMRDILGDNAPEVSKLMPELRQRYPDIPEPVSLPPEQERRYLLHGVSEFIHRGAAGQPMLLIFEDVHWADSSTCILLRYLADRIKESRVLILGTYRESELETGKPFSRTLQELNRERLVEDIQLNCLPQELVESLLHSKAGKPPPKALTDLVFSETEGNPFFIEELYRHLLESGKMFNDSGDFASDIEIADTEVPRGVKLIIGERLEKISQACRSALTTGSVIGRQFNFEVLLSASTKLDEDDLLDAMDEAMAERLVVDQSKDRQAIYGFSQEQVRQTLLSALSLPRRQRMHLRIADALEAHAGNNSDKYVAEIAHHLYQAGAAADEDRTVEYLLRAAERAMSAIAFEDAILLFDSAIGILPVSNKQEIAQIQTRRAAALQGMERFDEALDILQQAISTLDTGELQDGLILKRCCVLLDIWRGSQAIDDLEALLQRRRAGSDRDKELEAQLWVARGHYVLSLDQKGYAEKSIDSYEATIQLARELDRPLELTQALIASTQLVDYKPDYMKTAREHLQEADKLANELGNEDLQIEVATMKLNINIDSNVNELGESVLAKLESRRDPIRLNAHYFRMMWMTYSSNRLRRCVEICEAGTELAYRIGTLPVQYPTIKGMALMDLGEFDASWSAINEEISDEDHRFGRALQQLGWLQYEMDVGALDSALARAPHVIEESHALSRVWMLKWITNALARSAQVPGNESLLDTLGPLIESTGYTPDRVGRASLKMAEQKLDEAGTLLADVQDVNDFFPGRRDLNGLSTTNSLHRATENWQALKTGAEKMLSITEPNEMLPLTWQALLNLGQAEKGLGLDSAASLTRAEAIWEKTANTIPDPKHRDLYTAYAEKLGL
jgi:tetratricopeptide (TPR) repeat protein